MGQVAGAQILGRREKQEDSYRLEFQNENDPQSDVLMVVADGMGGHVGGEVASQLVCEQFVDCFLGKATATKVKRRLQQAAVFANQALSTRIKEVPELRGMGCTLIGALKVDQRLTWVSIGDSPAYLFRDGALQRINADHSLYVELLQGVREGKLTQQEADNHPKRHALRSALLGNDIPQIDLNAVDLQQGDCVVLATDGIDTLSAAEMQQAIVENRSNGAQRLAERLLAAVQDKADPKQDNTTVLVYLHGSSATVLENDPTDLTGSGRTVPPLMLYGGGVGVLCLLLASVYLIARPAPGPVIEPAPIATTDFPAAPEREEPRSNVPIGGSEADGDTNTGEPTEETGEPGRADTGADDGETGEEGSGAVTEATTETGDSETDESRISGAPEAGADEAGSPSDDDEGEPIPPADADKPTEMIPAEGETSLISPRPVQRPNRREQSGVRPGSPTRVQETA